MRRSISWVVILLFLLPVGTGFCESIISKEVAELTARSYFSNFLTDEQDNPLYLDYCQYFGLSDIGEDDCYFIISTGVIHGYSAFIIEIYPKHANNAISILTDNERQLMKWAIIYIDSYTGNILDFDHDDCFKYFDNWYPSSDISAVQNILKESDLLDFSIFSNGTDLFVDEMINLAISRRMVEKNWPIELYCTGMSHDEAVFRIISRYILFWRHMPRTDEYILSAEDFLFSNPSVVEYGRINMPEVLEEIEYAK